MKLTNKLIAGFTAMAVVASNFAFVPALTVKADNAENMMAYEWAFDAGLTTMTSYSAFMPSAAVTREAAARFLVQGAEALGATPTSDQTCDYSDLASADQTLTQFINEGCEMGIFKAQDLFNPKSVMTRSQAELTIARVIYGMEEVSSYASDNGITEFAAARELLMADEVVQVEVPGESAVQRLHLILMLYRLADMPVVDPTDPTNPTEPVEVKQGNLDVSLNAGTLANNSQIPAVGTVRFAAVNFSATSDVNLKSVTLSKLGLATIPTNTRVWFEKNGQRVTGRSSFTSEGKSTLSFAPALTIKGGSTEVLDLYVELDTDPAVDFQFQSTAMDTSAVTNNGGFTTPNLRTVNYNVVEAVVNTAGVGGTSSVTANGMEIGAFKVQINNASSETKNGMFKSITLRQNENASLTNLGNIVLERNGMVVASNPTINGRDMTFSVNDTILDGQVGTYYIKAIINTVDQSTDSYEFEVRNTSDVNIVEGNTAFRATVTGVPLTLNTYDIQGGDITFTRDTSVALSTDVAPGSSDVVFMKGTIKTNSAITVEDPTIVSSLLTNDALYDQFSTVYLQIGSSTFSYSPVNGSASLDLEFLGTATIDGTANVKMWATLKQTAPAATIKFNGLKLSDFNLTEYVSNGNSVNAGVGTIEGVSVTVESSVLNITRIDGLGNSTIAKGTTDFTVLKLNLASTQGNGVRVSRAQFNVAAPALANNNVSLSLYVNGTVVQTKNVNGATVFFDNFNVDVKNGMPATLEVKATFSDAFNAGTFGLTLPAVTGLNAVDLNTSAAVAYSAVTGAVFTIGSADATVTASSSPVLAQLLLSPSTMQSLLAFRVQAVNDAVKLRDLTFAGTNLNNLANFRIVDGSNNVIATATTANATSVTFTNIPASAPSIAKDAIATYKLVADVNSDTTAPSVDVELTDLAVRASNGSTVTAAAFAPVASNTHAIAENTFVVAKAANGSKGLTTSALRFTVTAAGKNSITLDSLNFNNLLAGYDTAASELKVYRTSTTLANLAGASAVGIITGPLALSSNNVVDAGTTATFIVVLENTVVDGGSNSQDWSVSLTDIDFNGTYTATDYDNVGGGLALTESK